MKKAPSKFKWLKRIITFMVVLVLIVIAFSMWANYYVIHQTEKSLYNSVDYIPYNKVALVLGTSKYTGKGTSNFFYKNRIDAAVALYMAGKAKYLILSGDNGTMNYNEPMTMKKDLVAAGVPESALILDYAGFRTLDAVVRAKEIFGQSSVTVVSQQFHNYRAVYLCKQNDIDAIAYNAPGVPFHYGPRTYLREYMARVLAILDVFVLHTQPKFLGKKIVIPG